MANKEGTAEGLAKREALEKVLRAVHDGTVTPFKKAAKRFSEDPEELRGVKVRVAGVDPISLLPGARAPLTWVACGAVVDAATCHPAPAPPRSCPAGICQSAMHPTLHALSTPEPRPQPLCGPLPQDEYGRCFLHHAAQLGHLQLCEHLVDEMGFNVNAQDSTGGYGGLGPVAWCRSTV